MTFHSANCLRTVNHSSLVKMVKRVVWVSSIYGDVRDLKWIGQWTYMHVYVFMIPLWLSLLGKICTSYPRIKSSMRQFFNHLLIVHTSLPMQRM